MKSVNFAVQSAAPLVHAIEASDMIWFSGQMTPSQKPAEAVRTVVLAWTQVRLTHG